MSETVTVYEDSVTRLVREGDRWHIQHPSGRRWTTDIMAEGDYIAWLCAALERAQDRVVAAERERDGYLAKLAQAALDHLSTPIKDEDSYA